MLNNLAIKNFALISNLEINFPPGFSILTGETGAGKSIVLGALSLILGQRADAKSIKEGAEKCIIEGTFNISAYNLQAFFEANNLEYDENQCILRRELYASGKSRAFINDSPVGLNEMKALGIQLIDIHSQFQNLSLGEESFQTQVLDALAKNNLLRADYQTAFNKYTEIQKELQQLQSEANEKSSEEDFLQFQFKQLSEANLKEDEQTSLEAEAEILSHVEEIKTGLYKTEQLLSGDSGGILSEIKDALNSLHGIKNIYTDSEELFQRLESSYLELKDLSFEISNKQEKLELDPERLQFVNERLDLLFHLQQKHKVNSSEALILLKNEIEVKLNAIEHFDERILELKELLEKTYQQASKLATQLTKSRIDAAKKLELELIKKVSPLGIPNMQFSCTISNKKELEKNGFDHIQFLFSANKNASLKPVSEIASGGEISRLMLGIKALIAGEMALPTIIFDEIDTGVSGEVADKMGDIMQNLGKQMQVITITHLPQIAAKGSTHYFVYKEDINNITETKIRILDKAERIREIAKILSGKELTQAAMEQATNLIQKSHL